MHACMSDVFRMKAYMSKRRVHAWMGACTVFLKQFLEHHIFHSCTHAEDEGTARENSVSDCVSNMQPVSSAATVLVDLGQEDRFGQSHQGQVLLVFKAWQIYEKGKHLNNSRALNL